MAFDLGAAVGGFAQGFAPGLHELALKAQQDRQAQVILNWIASQGAAQTGMAGPQPSLPGATPLPPGAGAAQPAGPAGVAPAQMPPGGAPAPAAGPAGIAPMQQPPAGPSPGMAGGAPGPAAPAGPGASGPQPDPMMSGTAQPTGQGPMADTQKTFKSVLLGLKTANPHARPAEILAAADRVFATMKGIEPETAALLRYQAASLAIDQKYDAQIQKAQTAEDALRLGYEKLKEKSDELDRRLKEMDEISKRAAGAREYAADRSVQAAGVRAGGQVDAARIGAESRKDVAKTGAESRRDVAKIGATSRENVAKIGNMPVGSFKAPAYQSADDVAKAYKSGKLSRDQAAKILRDNGWAQ